jgi:hypothetical protein
MVRALKIVKTRKSRVKPVKLSVKMKLGTMKNIHFKGGRKK